MFVINARSALRSDDAFAPADQVGSLTAARSSARFSDAGSRSPLAIARQLAGQRVLVLVHGYNHTMEDAARLFQTVQQTAHQRFPDAYDAVIGYTWPAGASRLDYFAAKSRTEEAGHRLRRWLEGLWSAGCTVDIACHSLGARVTTAAVQDAASFQARNMFLLAAAAGPAVLDDVHDAAEHVYVFYTRNDAALGRWYWLFEWETPIGYAGPSSDVPHMDRWPNVTVVDCTAAVRGHYDYLVSPAFIDYLAQTLKRSQPPRVDEPAPSASCHTSQATAEASSARMALPD
jgi:esterase/lipase superfamily enzyme